MAALLGTTANIALKVSRLLRSYGANLKILPEEVYLSRFISGQPTSGFFDEKKLAKIKKIFWRHNIVGIAPFVETKITLNGVPIRLTGTWFGKKIPVGPGKFFKTGIREVSPWWQLVDGSWLNSQRDSRAVMVGRAVASKLKLKVGDKLTARHNTRTIILTVKGIFEGNKVENERIYADTRLVQRLLGVLDKVNWAKVSALIVPESKLPVSIRGKAPSEMTKEEYETWYCTPTVAAISTQIEEIIPGVKVKPIQRVFEAEAQMIHKIDVTVTLLLVIAFVSTSLAVASTASAVVLERRFEIGLAKAIGALESQILNQFMVEAALVGLVGGIIGYFIGLALSQVIGQSVFNSFIPFNLYILFLTVLISALIAIVGSLLPVKRAINALPIIALRGE